MSAGMVRRSVCATCQFRSADNPRAVMLDVDRRMGLIEDARAGTHLHCHSEVYAPSRRATGPSPCLGQIAVMAKTGEFTPVAVAAILFGELTPATLARADVVVPYRSADDWIDRGPDPWNNEGAA